MSCPVPELISETNLNNFFIQHFDGESGAFYTAVNSMEPEENREDVLQFTADEFADKKTKDELVAIDEDVYNLGLYVLKHQKALTVAEATTAVGSLTTLSSGDLELIWDNLFYQTITGESGYAREACLVLLLGNHFISKFPSVTSDDSTMQRLAASRVVLPVELFDFDQTYYSIKANSDDSSNFEALKVHMENAEKKVLIDQLNGLLSEIGEYKTAFYKTNNALEQTAIDTHNTAYKTEIDTATPEDYVDQFTEYSFVRYTDFEKPSYTYTRPVEIDSDPLGEALSTESLFVVNRHSLFDTKTFEEFEDRVQNLIQENYRNIFQNTSFEQEKLAIEGSLISKCSLTKKYFDPYAYMVKVTERTTGQYNLLLTVDMGDECDKITRVITTITSPDELEFTTLKSSVGNGVLTVDLTDALTLDLSEEEAVLLSTEIDFASGLKLAFDPVSIDKGKYTTGYMVRINPPNSQPDLKIPTGYGLRQLGLAEYKRVEQMLCCYVPGEVSHIENLMAREYKERSTRRLRRQEDTITTSSSTESETSTDTSTTSRFDIQKEISSVLNTAVEQSRHNGFSGTTSGTASLPFVGDVNYSLSADHSSDFSTSNSLDVSNSMTTNFAKDVTEQATQRLTSKISEERVSRIIEEFEEKNQHGFDNRKGTEHISGVYRWVDKIYKNTLINYGKRLQYEFMIPEPAEFHLIAKATAAVNTTPLIRPLDPRTNSFGSLTPLKSAVHLNEDNYNEWAAKYGATVLPPPVKYLTVAKTLSLPDDGSAWYTGKTVTAEITLPEGHSVETIFVSIAASDDAAWNFVDVSAAGVSKRYYEDVVDKWWFTDSVAYPELKYAQGTVPIAAHFLGHQSGNVTVTLKLARKWLLVQEWQLDSFNAIIAAYNDRLAEYKNALAELEAKQGSVTAENPAFYRQIENTVLKKNCIGYLTGFEYLGKNFKVGSTLNDNQVNTSINMDRYAVTAKFFEQAFEWNIMSYNFYPFYWGAKTRWESLYTTENEDPLFRAFLRSGMARVIVTVRPGFEEAVMYFMRTGKVWNGGEIPVIGDPLYVSLLHELSLPEYIVDETWQSRVPSTLTIIQAKSIALEAEGLPCYCDSPEAPTEEIIQPETDPFAALDVFIEGDTAE